MEPIKTFEAIAVPLDASNIDTDQIIPARFLRKPRSDGYANYCFHDLRLDEQGKPKDFILNDPAYAEAKIIVADDNFGCGSSRESAVWALNDPDEKQRPSGFKVVIAPSFGDIFYNNCTKNGVLPIRLPAEVCADIRTQLHKSKGATIFVDLPNQKVRDPAGREHAFDIDPFRKSNLEAGLDDIDLTLKHADAIDRYETEARRIRPWIFDLQHVSE